MCKIFQNVEEVADVCNQRFFFTQNESIDMEIVFSFVDESSHPPWSGFLDEFGSLTRTQISRMFEKCIQHHSEVDKGTFRIISECEIFAVFVAIVVDTSTGQ